MADGGCADERVCDAVFATSKPASVSGKDEKETRVEQSGDHIQGRGDAVRQPDERDNRRSAGRAAAAIVA